MTSTPALAIYLHWPFCRSKCPYCDFNSHVAPAIDEARWRAALIAELDHLAAQTPDRVVTSLFFGGGTPSLMAPETVAALIAGVRRHWAMAPDLEVTLEANPTALERERLEAFRAAGVNRLSLGVQALEEEALRFLGRGHDVRDALAALALAQRLFPRFSFDLIYARPRQSLAQWEAELKEALALAGDHLSVYQLTIEPGTRFAALHARGELVLPDEDLAGAFYETTQSLLGEAGFVTYEISNHARAGGACRHNLTYWRYGDYLGVGPGAHGRLTLGGEKFATRQIRDPRRWLVSVEERGHATEERLALTHEERFEELMMMGLRLEEGIFRPAFRAELGQDFEEKLEAGRLQTLIAGGFLELDETRLRATAAGRQRLNALLGALLA
ncbi:MAG TPA: radical SAM family heme chaperone HemW [Stellaceae bacterium]|nr:radical SAM family heme chaperone HemW [Stellaceae bacterium]